MPGKKTVTVWAVWGLLMIAAAAFLWTHGGSVVRGSPGAGAYRRMPVSETGSFDQYEADGQRVSAAAVHADSTVQIKETRMLAIALAVYGTGLTVIAAVCAAHRNIGKEGGAARREQGRPQQISDHKI